MDEAIWRELPPDLAREVWACVVRACWKQKAVRALAREFLTAGLTTASQAACANLKVEWTSELKVRCYVDDGVAVFAAPAGTRRDFNRDEDADAVTAGLADAIARLYDEGVRRGLPGRPSVQTFSWFVTTPYGPCVTRHVPLPVEPRLYGTTDRKP